MSYHTIGAVKTKFGKHLPAYLLVRNKNVIIKGLSSADCIKNCADHYKPSKVMILNKPDNKIRFEEFEINVPYLQQEKRYAFHSLNIKLDAATPFVIIPMPVNEEEKELNPELSFAIEYEILD